MLVLEPNFGAMKILNMISSEKHEPNFGAMKISFANMISKHDFTQQVFHNMFSSDNKLEPS
jgi:hypothetical protein